MKRIILAVPNSASESLKACINQFSDCHCEQIMNLRDKPISHRGKLLPLRHAYSYIHRKLKLPSYAESYQTKLINVLKTEEYECLSNYHSDICSFNLKTRYHITSLVKPGFIAKQHFPPTSSNRLLFRDFAKVVLVRDPEEVIRKYDLRGDPLISDPEFRQRILDEVKKWIDLWTNEPNTLVIHKNDLVKNSRHVLEQIGNFTDIKFDLGDRFAFPDINKSKSRTI